MLSESEITSPIAPPAPDLAPEEPGRPVVSEASRQAQTNQCVRALARHPDFPAFSQHVQKILAVAEDQEASIAELGSLILRDYSLTLRVLRMANALNRSGQPVLSISRAIILLGIQGVRNLASSLMIFDHFHNKSAGVRELMLLSMLTANHARRLAGLVSGIRADEAYLGGMIRNLGEILVAYYHPAQYTKILTIVDRDKRCPSWACLEVLEFTYEDLAGAVARFWGMPEKIASCTQYGSIMPGMLEADLFHEAVALGHQMTTAVYRTEPDQSASAMQRCLRQHRSVFHLTPEDVESILGNAIGETKESFAVMGVSIDDLRLQAQTRNALELAPEAGLAGTADGDGTAAHETSILDRLAVQTCALLSSQSDCDLNTLILSTLETIYRGGGFDRVVFAFLNQDQTHIEGRIGLGEGASELVERFKYRVSVSGGPVSIALLCKRTCLIDAAKDPMSPIPGIFGRQYVGLYPIVIGRKPVGCIYVDSALPRPDLTHRHQERLEEVRGALTEAIVRFQNSGGSAPLRIA